MSEYADAELAAQLGMEEIDYLAHRRIAAENLVDRHGMTLKQAEAMQDRIRKLTTPKSTEGEQR